MSYVYCPSCEAPMDAPSTREAIEGDQPCPACYRYRVISDEEKERALLDMLYRIEALEGATL